MSRIYKFRFWDSINKQMYPVTRLELDRDFIMFRNEPWEQMGVPQSQGEVMQFTERTDTNGVEIYHKDIVDYKGQTAIIEWQNEKWVAVSTNPLHVTIPLGAINGKDLRVIGNEYEGIKDNT